MDHFKFRFHFSENVNGLLLIYGKSEKSNIFLFPHVSLGRIGNLLPLNLVQGWGVVISNFGRFEFWVDNSSASLSFYGYVNCPQLFYYKKGLEPPLRGYSFYNIDSLESRLLKKNQDSWKRNCHFTLNRKICHSQNDSNPSPAIDRLL